MKQPNYRHTRAEECLTTIVNRHLNIPADNPIRGPQREAIVAEIEKAMRDYAHYLVDKENA